MKLIHFVLCSALMFFLTTARHGGCRLYPEDELQEDDDFSFPSNYQSLRAEQKANLNQQHIDKFRTPTTWMTEREFVVLERDNNVTFDKEGDQMPLQNDQTGEVREKLVHTVGFTSQIEYESVGNHPYTGCFKGARHSLIRFSPNSEQFVDDFRPSMGVKCFRDGVPSGNFFTMFGMLGQGTNSNPFWNDYTNHPPKPKELSAVLDAFTKVSDFVTMMGLSQFSAVDQHGKTESNNRFPFRIILHPTKEARYAIPNDLDMSPKFPFYIPVMQDLKFHYLFDVYAQDNPFSESVKLIGRFRMKTPFTTSSYGDKKLFFRHTRMEDDLKLRPEWEDFSHQQLEDFQKIDPVFFRPNLQFNH